MSDTNIAVTDEVWIELNSRKQPGDTFDDVLRRELGLENKGRKRKPRRESIDLDISAIESGEYEPYQEQVEVAVEIVRQADGHVKKGDILEMIPEPDTDIKKDSLYQRYIQPALREEGEHTRNKGWEIDESKE